MTPELESRLKAVYPTGKFREPSEPALQSTERDARLASAIGSILQNANLNCDPSNSDGLACSYAFTQEDVPPFQVWAGSMDNPAKLEWIRRHDQPYRVLHVHVSRVADFYDYSFHLWQPRGVKGYLRVDHQVDPPTDLWRSDLDAITKTLARSGFKPLARETQDSLVSFVTEPDWDSMPNEDPRWADDSFVAPEAPVSLRQCLFGAEGR